MYSPAPRCDQILYGTSHSHTSWSAHAIFRYLSTQQWPLLHYRKSSNQAAIRLTALLNSVTIKWQFPDNILPGQWTGTGARCSYTCTCSSQCRRLAAAVSSLQATLPPKNLRRLVRVYSVCFHSCNYPKQNEQLTSLQFSEVYLWRSCFCTTNTANRSAQKSSTGPAANLPKFN